MQTIYLDISNKGVIPTIYAKQGDVGRKFQVVLTDEGVPYYPTAGSAFSVWYSGASGEGNYTNIGDKSAFSLTGNKVTVEMVSQMLLNDGDGFLALVLNDADGNQISTWNIPYICEFVPGADSEEAKNYYTAFSETVKEAINAAVRAENAAKELENITPESIGAEPATEDLTHPGCYYRTVGGVKEWINPPMELGVEYRTTERYNRKIVYAVLLNLGTLPAPNSNIHVSTGVSATAIVRATAQISDGSTMPYGYNRELIGFSASLETINVYTADNEYADYSDKTGIAEIWYTKD